MKGAIIHTTPRIEAKLIENGFEIQDFPKQGDVKWEDEIIGFMDNFTGLIIFEKRVVQEIKRIFNNNIGIWNEGDAK
jgi:hypothetical protein